jgi:DNA-binding response OmpR family regulator
MTRVLLVEDDPGIAEPLARALRREGYEVDVREDGRAALEGAREHPDLVVLDLGLPHVDGLEVCRRMRADGRTMPVLILTARADEVDTVVGLDAGADDYVTKPFRLAELLARVRALLRRTPEGAGPSDAEDVRIDPDGRRAWFLGEQLQLTAKEFDLLRVLMREQGRVVTREQLMKEIWDTTWFGSTKTLDMHISVLRKKLGDDVAQPRYISTVRGLGFRFERPGSSLEPG